MAYTVIRSSQTATPTEDVAYGKPPAVREWVRTCQECGRKGVYPPPPPAKETARTRTFKEKRCKHCKSAGLDHGRERRAGEVV